MRLTPDADGIIRDGVDGYCRPGRLCRACRNNPQTPRVKPAAKRSRRDGDWQRQTTKGVYGNTVQGAWRRSNSGAWRRS